MTYHHHPREFLPTGAEAYIVGEAGIWSEGSFCKPLVNVREDGKFYATAFAVVFGGNFGAFEIWDAMREVAAWDGVTESARIKKVH